jgi:hypothetical protein
VLDFVDPFQAVGDPGATGRNAGLERRFEHTGYLGDTHSRCHPFSAPLWQRPVNSREKRCNPRIATLHCVIVEAPDSPPRTSPLPVAIRKFSMSDREQELKDVPHRPADKSTWPKGIRSISMQEADALATDAKGELYWHGKPVEIRRPLDLTQTQSAVAIIVAIATVFAAFGAVAQGFAAYNEWACKVGWTSVACPLSPPAQATPPPS